MGGSQGGDESSFARLLRETHDRLFGFIFSLVHNRADAEDIFQQTAIVLWQKFPDFQPGTNFAAWSMRVAHFEIKNYVKARRRSRLYFSDEILDAIAITFHSSPGETESYSAVALTKCIEKLNERDHRLLMKCYSVDRDYGKIAESEGKTVGAVYKAISRIRQALLACVHRQLAAEQTA